MTNVSTNATITAGVAVVIVRAVVVVFIADHGTPNGRRCPPVSGRRGTGGAYRAPMIIKTLWASVQDDPVFMRKINGWATVFWLVMCPVSILTGLVSSVQFVSALSLWALVSGHLSAWQAARVEVKQDEAAAANSE